VGTRRVAALAAAILVAATAGSAHAATTYPISPASPVWVSAQNATLQMQSPAGDYIGEGKTYSESTPTDAFVSRSDENLVTIGVTAADGNFWTLEFAAPPGRQLKVGTTYSGAVDVLSRSGTEPGISISGDSRGCGSDTGSFTVTELAFGPYGYVQNFHATFSQSCEGVQPPLTGSVAVDDAQWPTPPRIALRPAATAHVGSRGNVTEHGTYVCGPGTPLQVSGTLTQGSVTGSLQLQLPCPSAGTASWKAVIKPVGGTFSAGAATLQTSASATDSNYDIPLTKTRTTAMTLS
jgi:hypothetical protein